MIPRIISLIVILLMVWTANANTVAVFHESDSVLTSQCDGSGNPLPDGTEVRFFLDDDLNGPDADDPLLPLGMRANEWNLNTFEMNGAALHMGAGFFCTDPGLAVLISGTNRIYARIQAGNTLFESTPWSNGSSSWGLYDVELAWSCFPDSILLAGSGTLSGPLSGALGPGLYHVMGPISVEQGDTLRILPGTTLQFDVQCALAVYGNLQAIGTETDSIVFTTDTVANPARWQGVHLYSSGSHLSYCRIENGRSIESVDTIRAGGLTLYWGVDANINNCRIVRNIGGGVAHPFHSVTYFRSCDISENDGWGVRLAYQSAETAWDVFYHCLISNNSGGGVEVRNIESGGGPYVISCTIANNGGHGIRAINCGAMVYNSIVVNNMASALNCDVDYGASHCCFYGNAGGDIGEFSSTNANGDSCDANQNIFVDPLFVNTAGHDFHLQAESRCIGAATVFSDDSSDLEGNPYPNPPGSNPDIGAYEHVAGHPAIEHNNGYVSLIVAGPPEWHYRLYHTSGLVDRLVFGGLCVGTTGSVRGSASQAGWTATSEGDSIVFVTAVPLTAGSMDTFVLNNPDCADTIWWRAGDSSGTSIWPVPPPNSGYISVLAAGPPEWKYRLNWISGSLDSLTFSDLCDGTSGLVRGTAADNGWCAVPFGNDIIFKTAVPLDSGKIDTFVLVNPSCNDTVTWSVEDTLGIIAVPPQPGPSAGTLTLLQEGPPDWHFRLEVLNGTISSITIANICYGMIGSTRGVASALGWTATNYPTMVVFSSATPLSAGTIDTFTLSHPTCIDWLSWLAGDSSGSAGGSGGGSGSGGGGGGGLGGGGGGDMPENLGSVSLTSAGPTQWDYELNWIKGALSRLVFKNICESTVGSIGGNASALGWTVSNFTDSVVFTTPFALTSGTIAGFSLSHPSCHDTLTWLTGSAFGWLPGPNGPPLGVTVRSPNGSEVWRLLQNEMVYWQTRDVEGNVRIELNRVYPSGEWELLADGLQNDGQEIVSVAGLPSQTSRVRVSVTGTGYSDESDEDFVLKRDLWLNSPNGGELWHEQDTTWIQWGGYGLTSTIRIELNRHCLSDSWELLAAGVPVNQWQWAWQPVSGPASDSCRIRITSEEDPSLADTSFADFHILCARPSRVTGVSASDATCSAIVVTWQAVSGVDSFQVLRNGLRSGCVPGGVLTYTDTTAIPNVSYTYAVLAFNACGASFESSGDPGTLRVQPSAIAFITASDTSCRFIRVLWNNVDYEESFKLYRDDVLLASIGANDTSYVDSTVVPGTHSYFVKATNQWCGAGLASPAVSGTRIPVPINHSPSISILQPVPGTTLIDSAGTISWSGFDQDSICQRITVGLYYDNDQDSSQMTLIQAGLSRNGSLTWPIAGVRAGTYYIYGRITDDLDSWSGAYSEGLFRVNHRPSLVLYNPASDTATRDTVLIRWYAQDSDSGDIVQVDLFYSFNPDTAGRILIASGLSSSGTYLWSTAGITEESRLYVVLNASDAITRSVWRVSAGKIIIDRTPPVFSNPSLSVTSVTPTETEDIALTVQCHDDESGVPATQPRFSYKRGSEDVTFTMQQPMTKTGMDTYQGVVPCINQWIYIMGEQVTIRVTGCDSAGNCTGPLELAVPVESVTLPEAVSGLVIQLSDNGRDIILSWPSVQGAASYQIYAGNAASFQVRTCSRIATTSNTSWVHVDAVLHEWYFYVVTTAP